LQISRRTLQDWEQARALPHGFTRAAVEWAISGVMTAPLKLILRPRIGFIFQSFNLIGDLDRFRECRAGADLRGMPAQA
jgi:ABC-type lipoprotein export system ATPase subunit